MRCKSLYPLIVVIALCFSASAQSKPRLLDKETFMEMESVGSPQISPDGKQVIFTRTWVDKMKDQYRSNLWIVDADGAFVVERFQVLAGVVEPGDRIRQVDEGEAVGLLQVVDACRPTDPIHLLRLAQPSLRHLSESLPPLRSFARALNLRPGGSFSVIGLNGATHGLTVIGLAESGDQGFYPEWTPGLAWTLEGTLDQVEPAGRVVYIGVARSPSPIE